MPASDDKPTGTRGRKTNTVPTVIVIAALLASGFFLATRVNPNRNYSPGDVMDNLDGVSVYYNGRINETHGRNLTEDGYNLGVKYQCVEFVKRYYYEHYGHRMPDSYGNAVDFFEEGIADVKLNERRGLIQYTNPSSEKPKEGDLLVYAATSSNEFGHVAIVASVEGSKLEIIQQNAGKRGRSRARYNLSQTAEGEWQIGNDRIMGWLRMPPKR